jgi:L-ascorbate metabolism protein UlaG (beta-lactamase superfamily)
MLSFILFLILIVPVLGILIGILISAPRYTGAVSDHFDGKNFYNPNGKNAKGFKDAMKWMISKREKKVKWVSPPDFQYGEKPLEKVDNGDFKVTFIGHSTVLLQFDGLNILTDPVWYERCSPVQWAGPKRIVPAGIRLEDLPKIDIILQSHNHWDHLDIENLKKIYAAHRPKIFTSLGISQFLKKNGIDNAVDMDWWDELPITVTPKRDGASILWNDKSDKGLKVTCVPSQHFSGRGTLDRNGTLWSGFVVSSPSVGNIYFAGDSGYGDFFKEIGDKFGSMRLSLIPVGAYQPIWFMSPIHCTPEEAVQIHHDVRSEKTLAIHHSTFPLADDGQFEALEWLHEARILRGVHADDFFILKEGSNLTVTPL